MTWYFIGLPKSCEAPWIAILLKVFFTNKVSFPYSFFHWHVRELQVTALCGCHMAMCRCCIHLCFADGGATNASESSVKCYPNMPICLPCWPGCKSCQDSTPCWVQEDRLLRAGVLALQGVFMFLVFVSMLVSYQHRQNRVSQIFWRIRMSDNDGSIPTVSSGRQNSPHKNIGFQIRIEEKIQWNRFFVIVHGIKHIHTKLKYTSICKNWKNKSMWCYGKYSCSIIKEKQCCANIINNVKECATE